MNRRKFPALMGGGKSLNDYLNTFVSAGTMPIQYRFNEGAGATVTVNYGSGGATLDGAITGCTVAQAGKLGAGDAYTFTTNCHVQIPFSTTYMIQAGAARTLAFLINHASVGQTNFSRWFGKSATGAGGFEVFFNGAITSVWGRLDGETTDSDSKTTTGPTAGQWAWWFFTVDDAADKLVYIHKGISGSASQLSYSAAQTAYTGALQIPSTPNAHRIGNNETPNAAMDASLDEFYVFSKVLSADEMNKIVRLSGV